MRVLITGITGFAGRHLAALCRAERAEVFGFSRSAGADVADADAVRRIVGETRPDIIFHLAAETGAADEPQLHRSTVLGTRNVLEAAAALAQAPRLLVASSSAVYGRGPAGGAPIAEDAPLAPTGPYGAAKAEQDALAERLGKSLGLPVVRARAFNQTGPGERDSFVASSVARQIAEIEAGLRPPTIAVGRTDTLRDFSDVRDIVRGYWLAATRGRPGEAYNLASGRAVPIQAIVDGLVALSRVDVEVEQDPARMRPADVPIQVGDASKARRELGWEAAIPLDRTLADLLEHWRDALRRV